MADDVFYPWDDAQLQLEGLGIDFSDIPVEKVTQAQLALIVKGHGVSPQVISAAYTTVSRLNSQAKVKAEKNDETQKDAKKTYAWEANIENSMVGTQASVNAQEAAIANPDQIIEWLPSSAKEQDIQHALFYGRHMTLGEAVNVHELGVRYGCKCGYRVV